MELKRQLFIIMKKLSFMLTVFASLLFASCSTGRYVPNSFNQNLNQTQVILSEANFKVVKHVSTSIVYQQSLTFDTKQLTQSAYAALIKKANLTGAQVLINVTIEQLQRSSGFSIFKKEDNAILASGTVIEFIDGNNSGHVGKMIKPEETIVEESASQKIEAVKPITPQKIGNYAEISVDTTQFARIKTTRAQAIGNPVALKQYVGAKIQVEGNKLPIVEAKELADAIGERVNGYYLDVRGEKHRDFRFTTESQELTTTIVLTNKERENLTAYAIFSETNTGKEIMTCYLGEGTMKEIAKKLYDRIFPYVK